MDYSSISKDLTSRLSKADKKNNGIYFTPPSCVKNNLQLLQTYMNDVVNVLEPSCGSGEYITGLHTLFPHLHITGIEYHKTIYESVQKLKNNNINILNLDFLKYNDDILYDLIIGNPPYYVMKKDDVDKEYYMYFEGRPNIFILFIIKASKNLKNNGILSFVLPKSFLNCLYYDKTRKYIFKNFQILHIAECNDDKYIETQQETIILIIQKSIDIHNKEFVLDINKYTIFTIKNNLPTLRILYKNSKSLFDLGFKVSVGNVVWNQCKDILTNDSTKTRLIYSSDIVDNKLTLKNYSNQEKKNYINKPGIKRPMIVINRGYGVGEYNFNYCILDEKKEYLIENHLICIEHKGKLSHEQLINEYKKIILSLKDKRTSKFISVYFGNNAINTTELYTILPIYQDI